MTSDSPSTIPTYLPQYTDKDKSSSKERPDSSDSEKGNTSHTCAESPALPIAAKSGMTHIPDGLRKIDKKMWVMWNSIVKAPLAPWVTGDLFFAKWGEACREAPERDLETVEWCIEDFLDIYGEKTPSNQGTNSETVPISDDAVEMKPTPVLLHWDPAAESRDTPPDPPLLLVDLDDVRCPDCGGVTPEAADIVDSLNAYTEISSSGGGLHIFVRGELPERYGRILAELDASHPCIEGNPAIEMYDHGRMVGATWDHTAGTPQDKVPERQAEIEDLIDQYVDVDSDPKTKTPQSTTTETAPEEAYGASESGSELRSKSEYYKLDLREVIKQGQYYSEYKRYSSTSGGWKNGPHPIHGPRKSSIDECTNFGIRVDKNVWGCWACGSNREEINSGSVLELVAQVGDILSCGRSREIHNDPIKMAATCLYARKLFPDACFDASDDDLYDGEEYLPPFPALLGVLKAIQGENCQVSDAQELLERKVLLETAIDVYSEFSAEEFIKAYVNE